jgi:hypothetical protein
MLLWALGIAGHNIRCPLKSALSVDPLINGATVAMLWTINGQILTFLYQIFFHWTTFNVRNLPSTDKI